MMGGMNSSSVRNWSVAWGTFFVSTLQFLLLSCYLNIFCSKIKEIAKDCIPSLNIGKFYPKPHWTEEWKDTRRIRKSIKNTVNWERARAVYRKLLKEEKKKTLIKFAKTFTKRIIISKIHENIRKIKGKNQRPIHILSDDNQRFYSVPESANKLAATFSQVSSAANYSPTCSATSPACSMEGDAAEHTMNMLSVFSSIFKKHMIQQGSMVWRGISMIWASGDDFHNTLTISWAIELSEWK